jgi:hypothetical protein
VVEGDRTLGNGPASVSESSSMSGATRTESRDSIGLTNPPSGIMESLTWEYVFLVGSILKRCLELGPRGTTGNSSSHYSLPIHQPLCQNTIWSRERTRASSPFKLFSCRSTSFSSPSNLRPHTSAAGPSFPVKLAVSISKPVRILLDGPSRMMTLNSRIQRSGTIFMVYSRK